MNIIAGSSKPAVWKIGAEVIMWWEDTPVSHVYIKLEVLSGVWIVFQAVGSGTEFCSIEYFLIHNIPMYEKKIEITPELFKRIISKAIILLKTRYSVFHLACLFYKRAVQYLFHKIIKVPFNNGQSEVCVQAMMALIDAGEIVRKSEDPNDMGIFEALEMLKAINGEIVLDKITQN